MTDKDTKHHFADRFDRNHTTEHDRVVDTEKLLQGLLGAQADTLNILEEQIRKPGKSATEIAMLRKLKAAVNFTMSRYQNMISMNHQHEIEMQQDNTELQQERGRAIEMDWQQLAERLMDKIVSAYKELGFDCKVAEVVKDGNNNISIKVEPEMPKGFEGRDPLKLSNVELGKAHEALRSDRLSEVKEQHPSIGGWTGMVNSHASGHDNGRGSAS